jgi:hypothetical protein
MASKKQQEAKQRASSYNTDRSTWIYRSNRDNSPVPSGMVKIGVRGGQYAPQFIYAPAAKKQQKTESKPAASKATASKSAAPAPRPPALGTTSQDKAVAVARKAAEDTLYGRGPTNPQPQLETNVAEDDGIDSVARFGNNLNRYIQVFGDAMDTRAKAGSYEYGRMLNYAAAGLPAAPRADGTEDLIKAVKKINELGLYS